MISMVALLPVFKLPFFSSPAISSPSAFPTLTSKYKPHTRVLLAVIVFFSLLTTIYRLPRAPPSPFRPGPRIINSGIWTIHFGIDNDGHDSQRGIMSLIKDMKLDIVGLLETDLHVSKCSCLIYFPKNNDSVCSVLHLGTVMCRRQSCSCNTPY